MRLQFRWRLSQFRRPQFWPPLWDEKYKLPPIFGVDFGGPVNFNGVGGGWTLGTAISCSTFFDLTITNGTFDTSSSGNYAVTCYSFLSNNTNVRTINLNASTVTLAGASFVTFQSTNLTFNAGTSTINGLRHTTLIILHLAIY